MALEELHSNEEEATSCSTAEQTADDGRPAESPAPETASVPKARQPWNASEQAFWPKHAILGKAHLAEQNVQKWIATYGDKFDQLEFAFNYVAGQNRVHVVNEPSALPGDLWFVGDVHGDILALEAALSFIDSRAHQATIVFLGDLFDRFQYGLEVVMRVLALVIERPGKIFWIAGNHDDGLFFDNGAFSSKVLPSEFCQFLNQRKEYEDFGKWLVGFCKILPRALFLPDGLFVAHGGCPSFDMNTFGYSIDNVRQLQDLEDEKYLHAFIWNRLIPGQDDKSEPEVGKNDLIYFLGKMEKLTGIPAKRMLRGHDHCLESRHEFFESYYPQAPVLTIATMSAWYLGTEEFPPELDRSRRKAPITTPAVAKFRPGELPEVFTLEIPQAIVRQFHEVEELPSR